MLASLSAAFLAGFVGSPHCMGMCGGFAVACGGARRGLAWHAGRITTYALLGAAAGAFGRVLPGPTWVATVVSVALLVWFAAALAGLVREPALKIPGLGRLMARASGDVGAGSRVVMGLATGLLPCGLLYAALALPVASGSAVVGASAMVAFGLGTAPALVALTLGARQVILRDLRVRRLMAAGVLVLGLVSMGMRQGATAGMDHGAGHEGPATSQVTPDLPASPTSLPAPAHASGG